MKDVCLYTIIDTLSWYEIWQLNGLNHIRVKEKTSQETERSSRKFLEPPEARNEKTLTIQWNLANLVKTYPGIVVRQHLSVQRQKGIAERAVRRIMEGTSVVQLQSGLDEKWWADSMECYCYLRHTQDLLFDVKTPFEWRFGEPFKGTVCTV